MTPEELQPAHEALQSGLQPGEICLRDGIILKIGPGSRNSFEFFCWRSPPMVRELDCFLEHSMGRRRLLDVGAHYGLFSLAFNLNGRKTESMALEPCLASYLTLMDNQGRNRSTIIGLNLAASAHNGALDMHLEDGHLVAEESRRYRHVDDPRPARCRTGDALCAEYHFTPDTIKIDAEGHELKVLRGLQGVISASRPLVFIEVHRDRLSAQGEEVPEFIPLLEGYDFIHTETREKIDLKNLPDLAENDFHIVCLPQ